MPLNKVNDLFYYKKINTSHCLGGENIKLICIYNTY